MKTAQQWFDKAVKKLSEQKEQSIDENGDCLYRGPGKLRCAIGHLIPNRIYTKEMELSSVGGVFDSFPEIDEYLTISGFKRWEAIDFFSDLQFIHDEYDPKRWPTEWKDIAEKYDLEYHGPDKI